MAAEKAPKRLEGTAEAVLIEHDLRGPEGPLFHGNARIRGFFGSL